MDLEGFGAWLERYFQAWVSNQPADVAALFTEDADYWVGPFAEPRTGRDAIVEWWVSGVQMDVRYAYEPLAVNGDTGVAHWNVTGHGGRVAPRYRTRVRLSRAYWEILGSLSHAEARPRASREARCTAGEYKNLDQEL
jgi:hypothetical protein